jgi:hypothetical protein
MRELSERQTEQKKNSQQKQSHKPRIEIKGRNPRKYVNQKKSNKGNSQAEKVKRNRKSNKFIHYRLQEKDTLRNQASKNSFSITHQKRSRGTRYANGKVSMPQSKQIISLKFG